MTTKCTRVGVPGERCGGMMHCNKYTCGFMLRKLLPIITIISDKKYKHLELINYFTYFSTVIPSNSRVFLSCRPFVVNTTFSTSLMGVEVSSNCPSQETEETSTPIRPIENVVVTTKDLQERNAQLLDGTTVE